MESGSWRCRTPDGALRNEADACGLDLREDPFRQTEVGFVGAAVGVAEDRGGLEAARVGERRGGVEEPRLDGVAAADVQRERDARVDLGLVELRELAEASPGANVAVRIPGRSCKMPPFSFSYVNDSGKGPVGWTLRHHLAIDRSHPRR